MTNLDIINDEIETLERKEITHDIAHKLASLYAVRDHMTGTAEAPVLEAKEYLEPAAGESVFMTAARKLDAETAWAVIDELMTTLAAMSPRLYAGVMRKLTE